MSGTISDQGGNELRISVDDVVWRQDDEELVVFELTTGTYMTLNPSAKLLWLKLADGCTLADLSKLLEDAYEISGNQALADASNFVEFLNDRKLLVSQQ
jgi:Coenzyme PQQ synthesis protein D (PqqD)